MSAETAMWWSDDETRRSDECVVNALTDRERWKNIYEQMLAALAEMHEEHITLCDNGCGLDFMAIAEGFKPHSEEIVAARARELAADRERW